MVPFAWLVSGLTTEVKKVKDSVALSFWKIPPQQRGGEARELTSHRCPKARGQSVPESVSLHGEEAEPPWLYLF